MSVLGMTSDGLEALEMVRAPETRCGCFRLVRPKLDGWEF